MPVKRLARHTIGIILLLATVILWTASNFLASTIFADDSYSKPYFVTYVNSSFFTCFLVWVFLKRLWSGKGLVREAIKGTEQSAAYTPVGDEDEHLIQSKPASNPETNGYTPQDSLLVDDSMTSLGSSRSSTSDRLSIRETAWLSLEFCILWFLANYFVAACLEYTTVASSTVLASTSGIWTLIFGAMLRVEKFTLKKLVGTLASLAGIILISSVDLTGETDENRGDFPHKSRKELAIGDALAFGSAILYGIYTTFMKKKIGDEGRVDMPLFFGFVGLFNLVTLLPGFFLVHFTGIETFELPPTRRITTIVMVNSATSLVGDFCWAYSTLLTSPLVVTVGLSLSIPLSLLGQMIVNGQTSSALYWIGAVIVLLSFVFINYESKDKSHEDTSERNPRTGPWAFAWRIWDRMNPWRQ
ncbi:uncharacterized protein KY384_004850 [Bacidia gigantensis]|uniref:uncharacterized protein n=1 Tax=Bacidia gigantensis TaxID=2732470 RepID=UPI001D050D2E|nr:uncharacterized protein KY384_004850 [Bacidia gigantensis]KAG8530348.1 hypothetical protein KY384_004850 [Bacidia gigantensis]